MAFKFRDIPKVEIDGKLYEVDASDPDYVSAVARDFPEIIKKYGEIDALKEKSLQAIPEYAPLDKTRDMARQLVDMTRELAETARDFIISAVGKEAYDEIFSGRRPNCVNHIDLCAYIYAETIRLREDILKSYAEPPDAPETEERPNADVIARDNHSTERDLPRKRGFPTLDKIWTALFKR